MEKDLIQLIKENTRIIEECEHRLRIINKGEQGVNIELRVFTKGGWNTIDYKPNNKAIQNMVIHQLRLDLESKIKKAKTEIKNISNKF